MYKYNRGAQNIKIHEILSHYSKSSKIKMTLVPTDPNQLDSSKLSNNGKMRITDLLREDTAHDQSS